MSGTEIRKRAGPGLTLKLFIATATVVVAVLVATLLVAGFVARQNAERAIDQRLTNTGEVARRFIDAENAKLASGAAAAAQTSTLIAAIPRSDAGSLLDLANTYKEILGANYALITDNQGVVKARTDRTDAVGQDMSRSPLIGGALDSRQQVAGYVNLADQKLFLAVSTPIKDLASGVVLGVLLATHEVTDSLAEEVKRGTGSEIVFYVLGDGNKPIVVASSVRRGPALEGALAGAMRVATGDTTRMRAEATIDGERLVGFKDRKSVV